MKNFSLTLYAFHLRHTLAHTPDQVVENSSLLWDNLVNIGVYSFPATSLKDIKSQLICYDNGNYAPHKEVGRKTEWLTNSQDLDLGSFTTTQGWKINVNLQPFLLNDTYAVDLTFVPESANNIDINISEIQNFKPDNLLPDKIQASLGQTLWIYGEVDANEDCQLLAEKIANALLANTGFNTFLNDSGNLFDSELFIYQAYQNNQANNPFEQSQIIIQLNKPVNHPQTNTVQLLGDAYNWLLNLLCCYHKILFINDLASQSYSNAREIYSDLDNKIKLFQILTLQQARISYIEKCWKELNNFKKLLSDWKTQNITVPNFDYLNNYLRNTTTQLSDFKSKEEIKISDLKKLKDNFNKLDSLLSELSHSISNPQIQISETQKSDFNAYLYDFNNLNGFFKNLIDNDLNKLLSEIPRDSFDYNLCLQDLQIHQIALETNIKNFKICLNKIKQINNQTSPQFWQAFADKECQKWQEQIQTDINYLTPGQELFSQLIDTIRGIVEIEQTKRDRSLERTVQILGIGFGGGAIVSGVIVQHIDKINQPIPIISPNSPPNPFYASLILSMIATILFIAFGWLITKRK